MIAVCAVRDLRYVCTPVQPRKIGKFSCTGTETVTDKADCELQIECEASEAIQCRCAKADEPKHSSGQRGQRGGSSLVYKLEIDARQWSARLESDKEKEWIMQRTATNARRFC